MMQAKREAGPGSESPQEWISAAMDGEAEHAQDRDCVDRLCGDPAARDCWALYHAVGDALRSSEVACWHHGRFAARVAAALQGEPTVLAPRAARLRVRTVRRVLLPGAAAAAAAAVIAVVAVPMLRGGPAGGGGVQQIAAERSAAPAPTPVRAGDVDRLPQLEAYLEAHQQLTPVVGMGRTTPYLRASAAAPER
jgi:sigma-E factor negative regulatory protein RseA